MNSLVLTKSEVKNISRSMAQGIKSIYTLRNCGLESFKKTLINSLVISHLQHLAVLLCSLSQHLITNLLKQLNWAVKPATIVKSFIQLTILN